MSIWNLVRFNETSQWSESVRDRVDAVWGVYAYQPGEQTHLCELTPSYCLYRLGDVEIPKEGLTDEQREELNADINAACTEPVTYMHCRTIDAIPIIQLEERKTDSVHLACGEFDEGPDNEEERHVRDWWCSNPIW